jgi:hypothetical protein
MVIDSFGLSSDDLRKQYPEIYQWLYERVKPERDNNKRESRKRNWWLFGETNPKLRKQLEGLPRYIATVETSKHRFFTFLDQTILPDNMLVNIALSDAYDLGILSSRIHVCWALATGAVLGPTPRYNKTRCFETYPFPDASEEQKERIRDLAEQLDRHRKRQLDQHDKLTMTGMYNVLDKLRSGETLTAKDKTIHEQGLVSVLKQLHDDLDRAVADAYGWPATLTDEEILERLCALNQERAAEEAQGQIRWLRPDFQNPQGSSSEQTTIALGDQTAGDRPQTTGQARRTGNKELSLWPKTLPEQIRVLRDVLSAQPGPVSAQMIAREFTRARKDRIEELLQTLVAMGQARETSEGHYVSG